MSQIEGASLIRRDRESCGSRTTVGDEPAVPEPGVHPRRSGIRRVARERSRQPLLSEQRLLQQLDRSVLAVLLR